MSDLSLAQHIEALWSDARQRVYAVVLGHRVPQLRAQLAAADVDDWDGLWTGELDPEEVEAAPQLVALRRGSAFSAWLHAEASQTYGDWGVFLCSQRPFIALRTHARALCRASLPEGGELRLDWADPAVLLALLPLAPKPQLAAVFGGAIEQIVIAQPAAWTRITAPLGQLSIERSGVLGAASVAGA